MRRGMHLSEAVKICLGKTEDEQLILFARPVSWQGTGTAIDLGMKLSPEKMRKICILSSFALTGAIWEVAPKDLLERWQIVTQEELCREVKDESGSEKQAGPEERPAASSD